MVDPETQILRCICRPHLEQQDKDTLAQLWLEGVDETRLIGQAEHHGLAPLLHQHLSELSLPVSAALRQQLIALKLRHQKANQARNTALEEILKLFTRHGINSAVLKGAALMHVLYATPGLRPMSDIDILVSAARADDAQNCLDKLGYKIHQIQNPYLRHHHHLPMAQKFADNVSVHIEIHTDALSGDIEGSIQLDQLTEDTLPFDTGNQGAASLGHIDMLRHLCHHTLEPVEQIKLGAVADLYGYATRYLDQINLQRLDSEFPLVRNTFSLLHYLSPLPTSLHNWVPIAVAAAPANVGAGFPPLSSTLGSDAGVAEKIRRIMIAPAWWLHCFYTVPADHSLTSVRLFRHPWQVMKWIRRRWMARFNQQTGSSANR